MPPSSRSASRPAARRSSAPGARPSARSQVSAADTPALADRFFRQIVSGMRNGVLAILRDGRLALINDEAYRIFDLPRHPDDVGRPFAEVLRDQPDIVRVLSGAFDLITLPNRAELRLKGAKRVIGYTLSLVRDEQGQVTGVALFFKDLTRVEQLEERERLRDRLAAVGEMAAAIAHEVKNPLAGIEVMAGVLRRQLAEQGEAQAVLTDIIKEAKMANAIVQEVLEFVRPIRLQVDETSVGPAVDAAVSLAESKAPRGGTDVTVAVPAGLPALHADHYQLTQLFTNLLINAFEALGGRGHVRITARTIELERIPDVPLRHAVVVEVTDDGPGMDAELIDRVFNPFFTTKPQGSGLGLAIVRKIVDAHDGRIDLESAPGRGTTVRVTLPVTGDEHHAHQ